MKHALFILVSIAFTIEGKDKLTVLQGSWSCIEFMEDGKSVSPEASKNFILTVHEDNYVMFMGDMVIPAKFKIIEGGKINRIQITPSEGLNKGKAYYGAYQIINESELTIYYDDENDQKISPTTFSKKNKDGRISRWKRINYNSQPLGDNKIINSLGSKFKLMLPATFMKGAFPEEDGRQDEAQCRVTISKPFYIAEKEITKGEFAKFVQETSYITDAEKGDLLGYTSVKGGLSTIKTGINTWDSTASWRNPGFAQTESHPVVFVSWNDANEFCKWLSYKEKKIYRLPTEAEWEYAARGGTSTIYWWGNNINSEELNANLADRDYVEKYPYRNYSIMIKDGFPFTAPVGSFRPNGSGLYDVIGNVFEWVYDFWSVPERNVLVDPAGPPSGKFKIAKGGCFGVGPSECRIAYRFRESPEMRFAGVGFRIIVEVD